MRHHKRKKHSIWPSVKLRAQLFRIWFMKNILVWVQVLCITCVVCMLTGNITASTPILGTIVYPFFQPLVDEIVLIVEDKKIDNLMDFFAIVISILTSISIFLIKIRGIAQKDIKNNDLKIAMIQANLYFNSDGRLVKKTEKMVGKDLDGDGKISDTNETPVTKGLISGLFTAIKEFFTIASVDLSGSEEESQRKYEKVLDKENLRNRERGMKEFEKTISKGAEMMVLDGMENELSKKQKSKKTKNTDKALFASLRNKIRKKKEEIKREQQEEVVINNIDRDAEEKPKKEKRNDTNKAVTTASTPKTTRDSANDFLASLRK